MSVQLVNGYVLLPDPFQGPAEWSRDWEVETAEAVTGSQDRGALRPEPRPRLVFSGQPVTLLQSQRFEERIRAALKSGKVAIPYRGFAEKLASNASSTTVPLVPPIWKFAAADYVFLQQLSNAEVFEVAVINSITCGRTITLTGALTDTFTPADAFCWPLLFGTLRLEESAAPTSWRLGARLVFECDRLRLRSVPVTPCNFASNETAGVISLGWAISTGDFESIEVWRSIDAGAYELVATIDPAATSWSEQPEPGHDYCYRVRARNCVGYSAYTSPACETIAPGPGGEGDLPQLTSALLWLDAADAPNPVASWTDKSGNGNTASQSYAPYQPAKLAAQINGLPAVYFDSVIGGVTLPDRAWDLSLGMTFFAVYKLTSANGYRILFMLDDDHPLPNTVQVTGVDGDPAGNYYAKAAGVSIVGAAPLTGLASGSYQLAAIVHGTSERKYYVDGMLINSATAASTPGNRIRRFNTIGARSGVGAPHNELWLAELVVLNRALNDTDRALWEAWLMNKYAL